MTDEQKRSCPSSICLFTTLFLLGLLVAYPLSLGPFYGLLHRQFVSPSAVVLYEPLWIVVDSAPEAVQAAVGDYIEWWLPLREWQGPSQDPFF